MISTGRVATQQLPSFQTLMLTFLSKWIPGNSALLSNKDHHLREPDTDQNSYFQDRESIGQRPVLPFLVTGSSNNNNSNNKTPTKNIIPSSYNYGNDSPIVVPVIPATAASDVTASDLHIHNNSNPEKQTPNPSSLFFFNTPLTFLYRLASLWFISIAAASVLCSIPLSAIGLPFIIGFGLVSMCIVFITSLIFKLWISLLKASWRAVKSMFTGPLQLAGSLWKKATSILRGNASSIINSTTPNNNRGRDRSASRQPLLPINTATHPFNSNRRFSTSSRLTDRSFDGSSSLMNEHLQHSGKWRYYDPNGNNEVLQSSFYSSLPSPRQVFSPSISESSKRFDFDHVLPPSNPRVLNAAFHELNSSQRDRLEMCTQLYSLTTNTPMDQIDIGLGLRHETGNTHYILSLWNEPNLNEPLELTHLIGFCEVTTSWCPFYPFINNIYIVVFRITHHSNDFSY